MSLLEKIKSMFSGDSSADADAHAGHDHSGHDHSHDDEHGHDHPHDPVPAANAVEDDSTPA